MVSANLSLLYFIIFADPIDQDPSKTVGPIGQDPIFTTVESCFVEYQFESLPHSTLTFHHTRPEI